MPIDSKAPLGIVALIVPLFVTITSPALMPNAEPLALVVVPEMMPVLLTVSVDPKFPEVPFAIETFPFAEIVPPLLLLTALVPFATTMPSNVPFTEVPDARLTVLLVPRSSPATVPVTDVPASRFTTSLFCWPVPYPLGLSWLSTAPPLHVTVVLDGVPGPVAGEHAGAARASRGTNVTTAANSAIAIGIILAEIRPSRLASARVLSNSVTSTPHTATPIASSCDRASSSVAQPFLTFLSCDFTELDLIAHRSAPRIRLGNTMFKNILSYVREHILRCAIRITGRR